MTFSDEVKKTFITFYGTFVDTPEFGSLRIRKDTAVGVCMDVSIPDKFGKIQFIVEDCKDPLKITLQYDSSLIEENIQIVVHSTNYDNHINTFFFPGFIDTHIHASQYPNCGILGNDSTLLDWLNKYTFPTEAALSHLPYAEKVYDKVVSRTLANGTTTATYFTTIDLEASKIMAKTCVMHGQRALIGKVCMDSNSPDYYIETCKESVSSLVEFVDYIENELCEPLIQPIVTPRFAPSCSRNLMEKIGNLAKDKSLHIQTHLSENFNEINWVKELFPECESYTDVYNKYGLLNHRTILAHSIHLTAEEIDLIKLKQSGIAHCPISNTSLTSGECPIKQMYTDGIEKIGLGTDVSAGYSCSILESAKAAFSVSRHLAIKKENQDAKLSVNECLYLATMGGAKVLDMEKQIGSFEIGKSFDCQEIDLRSPTSTIDIFEWQVPTLSGTKPKITQLNKLEAFDINDVISKWFFNADDRNVVKVWVNGHNVKN
ncbi:similar to Saccharomyces cerevisiae YDL238C GUD1 Guanine deaminase, a catabolic enzyme of the guanine salvage pathway producing xanthine and ammonia from guanine [Maudiozyma barnettii]|uniref:Guanine deaminase n=1 Tax=Maudiozyma barnettii TaxID=61262 RepID=A0A8H2VI88_9SACH|nr:guanine deaminase [Kazachstania barnettii]CAB4255957.1 similar to Saccharomyces cerevisiae YDL238C GUD1 Guanine deaminase, a catabolic enzyme of the guanine salvage pathway producing xanthine and ammonia from guanine [Kazachstania barnettii]CAD1784517.1 similar to Saccharomyces cerevisiae YDL238C GUD1 Guanine deaminase, a catabolic enzyme of the guanine salvage pathway producing xanthine and ammonia from guanine [Kazachstania barnettii]